ncbi:MAG: MFS transporter [Bacilli bacterium]|nr:MFS transporter [Bacilli bacterium]
MEQTVSNQSTFKLNYKRTFLIGFAFFGILLLWQVYDLWCPTFLTEMFAKAFYPEYEALRQINTADAIKQCGDIIKKVQYPVGIMMAIDNIAALILMPVFGHLSDKTNTKIGKRMPYILIGTFVCAIAFPFIPVLFHFNQLAGVIIMMAVVVLFAMMYRNPAVALMPDITPKPLRSKANGIINIMGYIGGAFATVVGLVFVLSRYLGTAVDKNTGLYADHTWAYNNIWAVEGPFLVASVLMLISAIVLFVLVKENKIKEEMKDELARGEAVSETADKVDDDKPLSKANKIMLFLILGAEFFWFMADNGVSTFLNNYVIYGTHSESTSTMILTILGGLGSVAGFALGGIIASKIGRKWTLFGGLALSLLSYLLWALLAFTAGLPKGSIPIWLYIIWLVKGFGMSLVHVNSFPMVVELCNSKKIGRFTGYYYAASMSAQTITPIALGGLLFIPAFDWRFLPVYAGVCIAISLVVFFFVKNVKSTKTKFTSGLEAIGDAEE